MACHKTVRAGGSLIGFALFMDVNPIPVKEAMNLLGYAAGCCRLPLDEPSENVRHTLSGEMKVLALIR